MCLSMSFHITDELLNKTGKVTVYKIYQRRLNGEHYNHLISLVREMVISGPGKITSNRSYGLAALTYGEIESGDIEYGIHVYRTDSDARDAYMDHMENPKYTGIPLAIVKLEADYADFVAANAKEAVFTKVYFTQEEWNRFFPSPV